MEWLIIGIIALLLLTLYFSVRLFGDLMMLAVYALVGIVKLVTAPFRHRHR